MKRRGDREREDADAREQAEVRREALLAELKAREAASRAPESPKEADLAAESAAEPFDEVGAVEGDQPAVDEPDESARPS